MHSEYVNICDILVIVSTTRKGGVLDHKRICLFKSTLFVDIIDILRTGISDIVVLIARCFGADKEFGKNILPSMALIEEQIAIISNQSFRYWAI
jgi:hypothetical protein